MWGGAIAPIHTGQKHPTEVFYKNGDKFEDSFLFLHQILWLNDAVTDIVAANPFHATSLFLYRQKKITKTRGFKGVENEASGMKRVKLLLISYFFTDTVTLNYIKTILQSSDLKDWTIIM